MTQHSRSRRRLPVRKSWEPFRSLTLGSRRWYFQHDEARRASKRTRCSKRRASRFSSGTPSRQPSRTHSSQGHLQRLPRLRIDGSLPSIAPARSQISSGGSRMSARSTFPQCSRKRDSPTRISHPSEACATPARRSGNGRSKSSLSMHRHRRWWSLWPHRTPLSGRCRAVGCWALGSSAADDGCFGVHRYRSVASWLRFAPSCIRPHPNGDDAGTRDDHSITSGMAASLMLNARDNLPIGLKRWLVQTERAPSH